MLSGTRKILSVVLALPMIALATAAIVWATANGTATLDDVQGLVILAIIVVFIVRNL